MSPDPRSTATAVLSLALVALGVAILVRTIEAGGGATSMGILVGALFIGAGAGRFWVSRRGR